MIDPVTMFRDGGPWMYLILVVTTVNQLGVVVLFGTLLARLRVPSVVWIALGTLPLFAGLLGTFMGTGMALDAVATASAEMQSVLAAAGTSVALFTTIFGAYASAFCFLCYALATGLALLIRPGKSSRITAGGAIVSFLVAGITGIGGLLLVGPFGGLVGLATGFALFLGGIRFPEEEERDRQRAVAARAAIGWYGTLAAGCVSVGAATLAYSTMYSAQSRASAEMRETLMRRAMDGFSLSQIGLGSLVVVLLLTMAVTLVPGSKDLTKRAWITAFFAGLTLLPLLGMFGVAGYRAYQLVDIARPAAEVRTEALAKLKLRVPESDAGDTSAYPGTSLTVPGAKALLGDAPVDPSSMPVGGQLAVEASSKTPLSQLQPLLEAHGLNLPDRRPQLCLAVRSPKLACLWFSVADAPTVELPGAMRVKPRKRGWAVHFTGDSGVGPIEESGLKPAEVRERIAQMEAPDWERKRRVTLWMPADATWGDLAKLLGELKVLSGSGADDADPFVRLAFTEPPPFPTDALEGEELEGEEGLDASIRAVVDEKNADIQRCYEQRLASKPGLQGQVTVQVNVGPDGGVITARVADSTIGDPKVETCLVSLFRTFRFTAPGSIEVVRVPLDFSPQ